MSIFACLSILQMSIDSLSLLVVANILVQLYTFFSLLMFTKCLWSINFSSYGQIILKIWKTIGYTIYLLYYNGYLRRFHNICWWSCCMVNSRSPLCKPTLETKYFNNFLSIDLCSIKWWWAVYHFVLVKTFRWSPLIWRRQKRCIYPCWGTRVADKMIWICEVCCDWWRGMNGNIWTGVLVWRWAVHK